MYALFAVSNASAKDGRFNKVPLLVPQPDTSKPDSLKYPISDRRGDSYSSSVRKTFDLKDPANISDSVYYDPKTKQYYIVEKIGNRYYRNPTALTFEEFQRIQNQKLLTSNFQNRRDITSLLSRNPGKSKLKFHESFVNRLFNTQGGLPKVDIRPQGYLDITTGYQKQNVKNPTLPLRAQKNGVLDFNMNANLNVNAQIGDKLKFPINYNTLANFDFENQLALRFGGGPDDIVKGVEAGNVTFPLRSTLIQGASQIFGIKTQLQFGKLTVAAVIANQKSSPQRLNFQGGASTTPFEIKVDDYEENRHFLLAQYFRSKYNDVMSRAPAITSPAQILRLEVWVTNRNGTTTNARNVVGFMDLAEKTPYRNDVISSTSTNEYPDNGFNSLYQMLASDPSMRDPNLVVSRLQSGLNLLPVQDFEKTFARKLDSSQYRVNRQLGFISLSQPLQPDEVLAVAYQYTYNGRVYQVGEFSSDVSPDTSAVNKGDQKVLFLKLLKATSQRPTLPVWDLMMKNIYSPTGFFGTFDRADFKMQILYQEPGAGEKRYFAEGDQKGVPILSLVGLDRLNNQNDPQPDGVFDYIEDLTVVSNQARIIFPTLEPFGKDLEKDFSTPDLRAKYIFYPLYDSIKWVAQNMPNLDRFVIKGVTKGGSSSGQDTYLGSNLPPGSVRVTSGGQLLKENIDYTVDYTNGSVKVINPALLNSGVPVQVAYENNQNYGLQQRQYMGLRFDYSAINKAKKQLNIGGTIVRLGERPFFTKMNYNDDPIRNTMYGADVNFRSDWARLTKWLDKLPNYNANGISSINGNLEAAYLKPGHPPQIGKGGQGLVYIDDFEGTRSGIDLRFPFVSWALASTPAGDGLFPEATLIDNLDYGKNRAKLAWYNIESTLQETKNPNNPLRNNPNFINELSDPRTRLVTNSELFPQRTVEFGQNQLVSFDLAYYPAERGQYNYESNAANIDANGKFYNPKGKWGGIMRALDQIDFETNNIEFVEFWIQDPFIKSPASKGGQLYFDFGNVSEDILKDGKRMFENGLSTPNAPTQVQSSNWGNTPKNPIQLTQAFNNDPADRPLQDVGFDGLTDTAEQTKRKDYLDQLKTNFGANAKLTLEADKDPSNDNYKWFRDADYDAAKAGILQRYKNYNNPQGNSPISSSTTSQFAPAATLYPDNEDLNRDNTLNETEEYFEYKVDLKTATDPLMQKGNNYIVDKRILPITYPNGTTGNETWYLFRIPINQYTQKIGNIPDFKSIRFVRMFLTGFEDSTVVRFAKLELVRNQWRAFNYQLDSSGNYIPLNPNNNFTTFNISAVNVEENDRRSPVPYKIPPGIERVQQLSNNGVNLLQNEQALSMQVCGLEDGKARAIFRPVQYDLRQYKKLSMFIHAEGAGKSDILKNNELHAIIRLGTDMINNYYQIRIPLHKTKWGETVLDSIWPEVNNLDLDLGDLIKLKTRRTGDITKLYTEVRSDGKAYSVMGSPNLGEVKSILVGLENPSDNDGNTICAEVWINELRLSGMDETGGWAAVGRVDVQLSDLGSISVSASARSAGFGSIEQRVNERSRDNFMQFDAATSLELGKLIPKKAAISIPFYASYSQTISSPKYDPYDQDVKLKDKIAAASGSAKDSIRKEAEDFTSIKTFNFTNVRKNKTNNKKPQIWDISNLDFSYSYFKQEKHNPLIQNDEVTRHRGGIGYNFNTSPKYFEPFRKLIKLRTRWLDFIKEFNINPRPSLLSFRADINRQFGATRAREVPIPGVPPSPYAIPETYDKYFTFDRIYNMRWDITKSMNIDFTATNNARIDEPAGRLNTKAKKDTVKTNFWKFGRNTLYNQRATFSYNLPTGKIPLLSWINATANYEAGYRWIGASRLAVDLGNTIENSQSRQLNGQFDFTRIYSLFKFFRAIGLPRNKDLADQQQQKDSTGKKQKAKIKDPNALPNPGTIARVFGKLITSLKSINVNYNETFNTRLPGFLDSTKSLGNNWKSGAPGLGFIFGQQPDSNWLNNAAQKGWITRSENFNYLFQQNYTQTLAADARVEPFRDFVIDVNLRKSFSKNYNELFKDTLPGGGGRFQHLNPYSNGGFDITYIAMKTLFTDFNPTKVSATFKQFEANRVILSKRLSDANPYATKVQGADGYYEGYSRYAQDVLIPAFIAAYTGKDPNSVKLLGQTNGNIRTNPFKGLIPMPNWKINYNGLTSIPAMAKIFTNFSLSHGYTGNLSMNGYNSALNFEDRFRLLWPSFQNKEGNFIPYFLVPNVTIHEEFAPLFGVDMLFVNQMSAKVEYKKSRTLSLSLVDYQLSEMRSTEYSIRAGWRKRGKKEGGIKLPFVKKKLTNDLNLSLDITYRDDATANTRLDNDAAFTTAGQKVWFINPAIDYVLSNRVNIRFYFEQRRVKSYISNPPPSVVTRAGLQLRISLAQ
ncbi:MAG: cell surface protein SprA [Sphingobacteriales bacterium]|nr:cell surface protein SprA [Sphingobacteriales bacterium]